MSDHFRAGLYHGSGAETPENRRANEEFEAAERARKAAEVNLTAEEKARLAAWAEKVRGPLF